MMFLRIQIDLSGLALKNANVYLWLTKKRKLRLLKNNKKSL